MGGYRQPILSYERYRLFWRAFADWAMRLHEWMFLLVVGLCSHSQAAEFKCLDNPALGRFVRVDRHGYPGDPFGWEGESKQKGCTRVAIEGKIIAGDADKLDWLLAPQYDRAGDPTPRSFVLLSPGGSVLEAMTLGRLLRLNYSRVEARRKGRNPCGAPGQPVCCASACALAYLGGAQWSPQDHLGLHRPTLEDLGDQDYEKGRQTLENIDALIRQYFKEMEIDSTFFDAMMRAAPDQLAVLQVGKKYPPSLRDWLTAKCKSQSTDEDREHCMSSKFTFEFDGAKWPYDEAKRFTWYSYKSNEELNKVTPKVGPIRSVVIEHELEVREKDAAKR